MTHQPNLSFEYKQPTTKRNVVLAVSALLVLTAFSAPVLYLKQSIQAKAKMLVDTQANYDQTMAKITSNPIDVSALSVEVDSLKNEYARLTKENYHIPSNLFTQIEQALPGSAWVTEYAIRDGYIYLKGMSSDINSIEKFFNAIESIQPGLKTKVTRGTEHYEFEISTVSETK